MCSVVKRCVVRLLVGSSILLVCATVVVLGVGQAADIDETKLKTHALVTWYDVGAPAGKLLLIRKDANVCAIKFTEYHRANDAKSSTFFRSGDETRDAKYECSCQSEKGDGFGDPTLREVSTRSSWGIGRFAFFSGQRSVRCGQFRLPWMYPTRVSFHLDGAEGAKLRDHGIELAPTRWTAISEVNVRDPRLHWFRYDESRKVTYIPDKDL